MSFIRQYMLLIIVFAAILLIVTLTLVKKPNLSLLNPFLSLEPSTSTYVRTFSHATLENLWIAYRSKIQKDGRTIDRSRNYLTTSEGQSYALLRAVWMDDKETFDKVLRWTNNNLRKRSNDKLFAWKWGKDANGKWDVLTEEGGLNTASDADQDIALALIFATKRWNQDHYQDQAIEILNDIWRQEVLELNGNYYLLAGNWAKTEPSPTINPSYFSFMAYPIFAQVNPEHPWLELKRTSYEVLEKSTAANLGYDNTANVPPDWVSLDKKTGDVLPVVHEDKTTHFADDAFRAIWRVGLDSKWHSDERAVSYLKRLGFLQNEWKQRGFIYASYEHNGKPAVDYTSLSMYSGILPYFIQEDKKSADEIFYKKLAVLYNQDLEEFKEDLGYYAENWVWFGMAYYGNRLPNLYGEAQ